MKHFIELTECTLKVVGVGIYDYRQAHVGTNPIAIPWNQIKKLEKYSPDEDDKDIPLTTIIYSDQIVSVMESMDEIENLISKAKAE